MTHEWIFDSLVGEVLVYGFYATAAVVSFVLLCRLLLELWNERLRGKPISKGGPR